MTIVRPGRQAPAPERGPSRTPDEAAATRIGRRGLQLAEDFLDGSRVFSALTAALPVGIGSYGYSQVWGPTFAGASIAVGGVKIACAGAATTDAEKKRRIVSGALDMAGGLAAFVATLGIAPALGAVATGALLAGKLVYSELGRE